MKSIYFNSLLLISTLHAGFDFGECSGSGTFEQEIVHFGSDYKNAIVVGMIPMGIEGLRIDLISENDVDIRLYGENNDKIVHWPHGILHGSNQETKSYQNIPITYSGYNGVNGKKGEEFITVNGITPTAMTMKAFGYKAGHATVNYSWTGKEGCHVKQSGSGEFQQTILANGINLVGMIPSGIRNVEINLSSEKDLDIQLYGEDGTAIVSWKPRGLLSGKMRESINYHDMNITWSGYDGTNGNKGDEYIQIRGETTEALTMKVFGYQAGEARVEYHWGENSPKRVFIIGSSTVHAGWWRGEDFNDPYGENRILEGWGEALGRYLKDPSKLYNRARSGSHSIRYRTPENRPAYANRAGIVGRDWNSTESLIHATEDNNGGFLLIQFGAAEVYSGVSVEAFENELRAYVEDSKVLGLTPVLISPPTRRNANYLDNRSYAKYIKPIAEEADILFLDLYEKSKAEFGKYLIRDGNLSEADKILSYQQHFNGINNTHFGRNGAKIVAGWIRELSCESSDDRSNVTQEVATELCQQFVEGALEHLISMREDAEDGDIDDWETYGTTEGATVKNIYDPVKRSNVIELQGSAGVENGFRYAVTNLWEEEERFVLSWDMNYSEDFTFFVSVDTEDGYKIFEYKPSDSAGEMVAGRYRFGLGSDVADGRWHTFVRDLQADLQSIDPSKHILKIHRIAIRGSGRLDNIQTMSSLDAVSRDIAPTVALIDKAEITVNQDTLYIDSGVTVVDDNDENLTLKVETVGSVDTSTIGTYTLFYKVHDSVGNGGYAKRTVQVVDRDVTQVDGNVNFTEYPKPLKNPLKGFMIMANKNSPTPKTYVTLQKRLIHWNDIERTIEDGVDKVISYSQDHLYTQSEDHVPYNVEDRNLKSIPVVVLKKRKSRTYAPDDMDISEHDNQTQIYIDRIKNLVPKLAEAWDDDPRIGFVYMAIHGLWGEQLSPVMTPEVAQALGDSFSQHFHHKKVLVRVPHYFNQKYLQAHDNKFHGNSYTHYYEFGMFWDAFAWPNELGGLLDTDDMIAQTAFWRDYPLLGETSLAGTINGNNYQNNIYDYSNYPSELPASEKVRRSIHDTLTHESSLDYLTDYIKATHCTALSWIAQYNEADAAEARGAEVLQKAMGYRFVLKGANHTVEVNESRVLKISFDVENSGSAPFYYDWPVEIALLDIQTREKVWSDTFKEVDIRTWQSGDQWDFDNNSYKIAPKTYHIEGTFEIANNLPKGEYILALSILDPAGMQPAVRFAVNQYYKGGRTPLGIVGIGSKPEASLPPFDNIADDGLRYELK